jgi:hypothetical protein
MSSRVSQVQLQNLFESFAKACGKRITDVSTRAVGAWYLDGNNLGYAIYEVTGPHGAVSSPVSGYSARLSAREMVEAMHFAMSAIQACKRRRSRRRSRG